MRIPFVPGVLTATILCGSLGCQSGLSMPKFAGWRKKTPPASSTALTNAPPAPPVLPSSTGSGPQTNFGYGQSGVATATTYPEQPAAGANPYPTTAYPNAQVADYTNANSNGSQAQPATYGQPAGAAAGAAGGTMPAQSGPYNPVYGQPAAQPVAQNNPYVNTAAAAAGATGAYGGPPAANAGGADGAPAANAYGAHGQFVWRRGGCSGWPTRCR